MKYPIMLMLLFISLAGCHATPDSRYYVLSPSSSSHTSLTSNSHWMLAAVTVPEILNRPQIILKSGGTHVELLEYDRWAEPLESMIKRTLNEDLIARLGINEPDTNSTDNEHQIKVTIQEFSADESGEVTLNAILDIQTGPLNAEITKRMIFQKTIKADNATISSIVAAMSTLLGNLADTIYQLVSAPS